VATELGTTREQVPASSWSPTSGLWPWCWRPVQQSELHGVFCRT